MTVTPRDRLAAIAGRIAGIHVTIANINHAHAARGRALAQTEYEAAHMPGSNASGVRSSDTPDPTHNAAMRPKPSDPRHMELEALNALDRLTDYARWLAMLASTGNTNGADRPETGGQPCRGGDTHAPNSTGLRCNLGACGKPWPCNPAQPDYWWADCPGIIPPGANKCPRCELSKDHWICKDCPTGKDIHHRTEHARLGLCDACRKRRDRANTGDTAA